jgi:hypothetical protein
VPKGQTQHRAVHHCTGPGWPCCQAAYPGVPTLDFALPWTVSCTVSA